MVVVVAMEMVEVITKNIMIVGKWLRLISRCHPSKVEKINFQRRYIMGEQKGDCQTANSCGCKTKETTIKSSIRDKAEGTLHEMKGSVKEVIGKLSDNPKLEAEGTVEKIAGKVQEKIGQVKKVFGK
jgi:uncharacterized protein YjbJ (UPF0337 family)